MELDGAVEGEAFLNGAPGVEPAGICGNALAVMSAGVDSRRHRSLPQAGKRG